MARRMKIAAAQRLLTSDNKRKRGIWPPRAKTCAWRDAALNNRRENQTVVVAGAVNDDVTIVNGAGMWRGARGGWGYAAPGTYHLHYAPPTCLPLAACHHWRYRRALPCALAAAFRRLTSVYRG